jgi:hypothetical protein
MWNKQLIACARVYPDGVLTVVEDSGYPLSVRCNVQFDNARELILLPAPPQDIVGRQGLACLLFHRHNADLGGQHELLIKGELREEAGILTLRPGDFLTGSGRQDTDRMPYAGSPLDMIRYMVLGRRKARAYLAKRGKPWTPRPWGKMLRYLDES